MSLFFFPLRRSSVFEFQIRVWTELGPLFPLSFPFGKGGGGGGQGILLCSRLCHTYFVRIFQNLFIRLFHIPVLKPGFPSLFQHGQPEGIRRRRVWVPVCSGTVGEEAHYIWRSVDLFVYSIFVVYGPAYAGHVWAGSGGLGPDLVSLYCPPGQNCRSGEYSSSSSSSWAIWTLPSTCVTTDGFSSRWSSAACRRGPPSAGGADSYDGLRPPHALSKVWGHFLGRTSPSSCAQDQDAVAFFMLRPSTFALDLARTGPRRTYAAGPWSRPSHVIDGTCTPPWTCSPLWWTSCFRTFATSASSIVLVWP